MTNIIQHILPKTYIHHNTNSDTQQPKTNFQPTADKQKYKIAYIYILCYKINKFQIKEN